MHHLMSPLLLVGAMILIPGNPMAFRAHLQSRREDAAPFRDYFGPSTTATSSGKAPGAMTMGKYVMVECGLKASTPVIPVPTRGIQAPLVRPDGIATGIDLGVSRAPTAEGIFTQRPCYSQVKSKLPSILANIHARGRS